MHEIKSYIAGEWVGGEGQEHEDLNPARPFEAIARFSLIGQEQFERALDAGRQAGASWKTTLIHERARILKRAAGLLLERRDAIAGDISLEQGKNLAVARGEVARAAALLEYFAHEADVAKGELYASPRVDEQIFTTSTPVGQVLAITPWNVPLALPAWKIAPALVHGNTVVWKPSTDTPLIATHLLEALNDAGLPAGVCNLVLADGATGERMLKDSRVDACTFTGSTGIGRHLMRVGAERGIKVLAEMGGKNAAIICADADIPWAVDQVISASMGWTGQRCTATSRLLIERSVYEEVLDRVVKAAEGMRVGDPLQGDIDLGPLSTERQFKGVQAAIRNARHNGSQIVTGSQGEDSPEHGWFVRPTVVTEVRPSDDVFMEEIFGPVLSVVAFDNLEEAFELANLGRYGLSGSMFTGSLEKAFDAIEKLDSGVLHVNSESCGADPHVPFGGIKDSGTAHREMGVMAREFYTQTRTIYLRSRGGIS